ncbi:hypothetical protein GCM10007874_51870 [Labrys miyagiensis]|uniref:HTH deoR-type domain-containing protein n=1 Tax=Labrys miyagiensis TaxID=346912 RepID=A0ABQ6CQS4_9HYPH|nr:DeoR family transcriptional regulator [Labrys miyagiensis]GLS22170.1 hypothetical protein GCM10007874_51870 [Labrys miyagiensis]
MITPRQAGILKLLAGRSPLSLYEIGAAFPEVSSISIRRDIARLAEQGALVRTHGGAKAAPVPAAEDFAEPDDTIDGVDAIILPPIEGRTADTLRLMAQRRHIPFLAESAPQNGGIYLGPDNFAAGHDLGVTAGRMLAGRLAEARILAVAIDHLANTKARCDGFLDGFAAAFGGPTRHWRINGEGSFRISQQASLDVFNAVPGINIVFGVNDHSVLAALDSAGRAGIEPFAFSVGGEGAGLFEILARGDRLHACAALFPEIVAMRAVDALADAFAGAPLPAEIRTPHVVLTMQTLSAYYGRDGDGFVLTPKAPTLLGLPTALAGARRQSKGRSIGFVPHYPAHDWYRNMARALQRRAGELGLELRVSAPTAGIAREIHSLRSRIAAAAIHRVNPGDTVLINAGVMAKVLAEAIADLKDVTVITNAFGVLEHLSGRAGLKVILTSGEYHARERCLVGPSLGALFETIRVDKAFLSVDGLSVRFGASARDERLALATRRFADASREVFVLADHSLIGAEASHRIVPLRQLTELITDSGSLPADRLACSSAGLRVTLADLEAEPVAGKLSASPDRLPATGRK